VHGVDSREDGLKSRIYDIQVIVQRNTFSSGPALPPVNREERRPSMLTDENKGTALITGAYSGIACLRRRRSFRIHLQFERSFT
jgi:hypothetical protein